VWLVVSPVIAAGVLTAHLLAYRLTGTSAAPLHSYLEHGPQVVLLVALSALVLGAFGERSSAPRMWAFPLVAVATFVGQEHVERIVHGHASLSLVTTQVFFVGLLLQVPVALLAWALARWLLDAVNDDAAGPELRAALRLSLVALRAEATPRSEGRAPTGRGPPRLRPLC
jgi:hypothetical protein